MKVMALDPAGESFGVVVLEPTPSGMLGISWSHLLSAPSEWGISQKNCYMAHAVAAMIALEKPDHVVSEKPWGMGFSKQSLTELIGAIKAEIWDDISWQSISEARRSVLGDGWGDSTKQMSAEWIEQYPWSPGAKKFIRAQLEKANPETKDGYDILDAILHGLCFMVSKGIIAPKHKEPKAKKERKKKVKDAVV